MVPVIQNSINRKMRQLAADLVSGDSIDNITFDTEVDGFEFGYHLHSLYTNEISNASDINLRESLAGFGITYDVVLENTLRERAENLDAVPRFEIKPFQPVAETQIAPKATPNAPDSVPTPTRAAKGAAKKAAAAKKGPAKPPTNKPKKSSIQDMTGKPPTVSPAKSQPARRNPTKSTPANTVAENPVEQARKKYCDWVSKVGIRGVSEMRQKVESREGVEDSELPQELPLGKKEKLDRTTILRVTGILKNAGELVERGVHGYVPMGKLDKMARAITDQKRFI